MQTLSFKYFSLVFWWEMVFTRKIVHNTRKLTCFGLLLTSILKSCGNHLVNKLRKSRNNLLRKCSMYS